MNECIEKFLSYLKAKGSKEHTIKTYTRFVRRLLEKYPIPNIENVLKFLSEYRDCATLTQATCAYALRAFFEANPQFGIDYKLIPLPSRIEIGRKIVIIPEEDIKKMVENCEDIKTSAIIALMYECGLRISEIGKIQCGDLNTNDWTIYVRRSKGSVSSILPITTPWVKNILKVYITIRNCQSPEEPLFEGYKGKGLSYTRVSSIVKEILNKYGYLDAHPHDIRHSRATNLLKAGLDVVTVSKILGHKTISSTSTYLHLIVDDIRKKLESLHKT